LRSYIVEDDEEIKYFDGLVNSEITGQIEETEENENFNEISFEDSENIFIIEDNFFKNDHRLPKRPDQVKWIKELPKDEYNNLCEIVESALDQAKGKNNFDRIDGIIIIKQTKELIVLTEFYIIDFILKNDKYEIMRVIEIKTIDYITLTRDGSYLVLHLVPIIKNNENINKNFVINSKQLERVASCICSTNFYDKQSGGKIENRKISVVIINENFEILENLKNINNFIDYR
jgi:hypothetical protein